MQHVHDAVGSRFIDLQVSAAASPTVLPLPSAKPVAATSAVSSPGIPQYSNMLATLATPCNIILCEQMLNMIQHHLGIHHLEVSTGCLSQSRGLAFLILFGGPEDILML